MVAHSPAQIATSEAKGGGGAGRPRLKGSRIQAVLLVRRAPEPVRESVSCVCVVLKFKCLS